MKNRSGMGVLSHWCQSIFWSIGYFFGFNLVSIVFIGLIVPQEYALGTKRRNDAIAYRQHGKLILGTIPVAIVGWCFIALIAILIKYLS